MVTGTLGCICLLLIAHKDDRLLRSMCEEERKGKTTPFGVNLTRSQVLYQAAQAMCDDVCKRLDQLASSARAGSSAYGHSEAHCEATQSRRRQIFHGREHSVRLDGLCPCMAEVLSHRWREQEKECTAHLYLPQKGTVSPLHRGLQTPSRTPKGFNLHMQAWRF